MSNDKSFDLDEIIRFLKKRDYSSFDFYSEYSPEDAVIYTKHTGVLCICNVSDNSIPEQTVIQVIDVLEHLDECLEQAYEWLASHEIELGLQHLKNNWKPGEAWVKEVKSWREYWKETKLDTVKKRYTVSEICFRWDDDFWPPSVINEYWQGPEPPKGADVFFIDFCHRDCDSGFRFMFLCEDRRLYKFIIHIL